MKEGNIRHMIAERIVNLFSILFDQCQDNIRSLLQPKFSGSQSQFTVVSVSI